MSMTFPAFNIIFHIKYIEKMYILRTQKLYLRKDSVIIIQAQSVLCKTFFHITLLFSIQRDKILCICPTLITGVCRTLHQ